ncbi:hypothetical protein [Dactylosporangium darangshiense]|uniref:hypothetical protein n=1 Tax=Dactylosporangium darangshiense TaxID=579108 RepID=UPI0031EE3F02
MDLALARDLPALARSGGREAFRALVEPYRHEPQVHCYAWMSSSMARSACRLSAASARIEMP